MTRNNFQGAGGLLGGDGPKQPTVTDDTLRSKNRFEIILGLGEGPWKGLSNGDQSLFFNGTAYQNADGSYNFSLLGTAFYPGNYPGETIVPTLGGFEDFRGTYHAMAQGDVFTFTTNAGIDQVILRLFIRYLYQSGTDAQLAAVAGSARAYSTFLPNTLSLRVRFRASGGDWQSPFTNEITTVTGKTQVGEYHEIRLPVSGGGPYEVEVTNLSPDNDKSRCVMEVEGYYEVHGGLYGLSRATDVSQALSVGVPVTRTSDAPPERQDGTYGIDMLVVRVLVNQLYRQDSSGTYTSTVGFTIRYKPTSGTTWVNPFNGENVINGKTTSVPFVSEWRFPVAAIDDTYDIEVTRTTADDVNNSRIIAWESFQEIIGGAAKFDGTACLQVEGQASEQISSIPQIAGIYDMKIVKIPTNYNPYTRVYTGAWDGTFKEDWSSNPAWCLYDLCMNENYGVRRYIPTFALDKYDFYALGQYCDTPVPSGQKDTGGNDLMQPRFTCNMVMQEARGLRDQIRYMAGAVNATFIDDMNGTTKIVWDQDEAAVAIFTPENVVSDSGADPFTYSYTDISTRFNHITIHYDEPNMFYKTVPKIVQDPSHIARYGVIPLEVAAVGCTDGHEAMRRATFMLLTAINENKIVVFRTNRQGLMLKPFDVILVGDPDMNRALTGRIKSVSADRRTIFLRDALYLEQGVEYVFQTVARNPDYPDASDKPTMVFQSNFPSPVNGNVKAFVLDVALPDTVAVNAQFTVGCEGNLIGVPQPFRVTKIEPGEDGEIISIEAINIYRSKYALSDLASDKVNLDYIDLPPTISPPSDVGMDTEVISFNGNAVPSMVLTWAASKDLRVDRYEYSYRKTGDTDWAISGFTNTVRADVYNIQAGIYDARVRAVAGGVFSEWAYILGSNAGNNAPPSDVGDMFITLVSDGYQISWPQVSDANLAYYWLRFTSDTSTAATWETATDLIPQVLATSVVVGAMPGSYFCKAVNTFGIASENAASISTSTNAADYQVVETHDFVEEHWPSDDLHIGTNVFIHTADWTIKLNLANGNVGSYQFFTEDLGDVFNVRLNVSALVSGEKSGDVIGNWPDLASRETLSGVQASDYTSYLSISTLDGAGQWSAWQPFANGTWTGRRFSILLVMASWNPEVTVVVQKLVMSLLLRPRLERGQNVLTSTSAFAVTIDPPFHSVPSIFITGHSLSVGDYYQITGASTSGFNIQWYDVLNNPVARYTDYLCVGYGGRS